MKQLLKNNPLILIEAAIIEQLRRSSNIQMHEKLLNAPLIYDQTASEVLGKIYLDYIDIAQSSNLPILLCTPTWRANQERVRESQFSNSINIDAALYMQKLCNSRKCNNSIIKIGGLIGCKNDCYKPDEGLSIQEAQKFHTWQIEQLTKGSVDFLIAETIPNIKEALGIAKAMEITELPYIISFVISRKGYILDGNSLSSSIEYIDSNTDNKPLGYMVNCAYPSFICPAEQPANLFKRLIGYQANASSLDHCELENASQLKAENLSDWGKLMLELNEVYNVQILGGCCGTNSDHLKYIRRMINHKK